ncbi:hypothetical protein K438DRAFT_1961752 [Mycena galopus ATCC 62051]|nr:hypothetical protein K438DRAFT_1961752 [Mycena galopus ATCC 62051]
MLHIKPHRRSLGASLLLTPSEDRHAACPPEHLPHSVPVPEASNALRKAVHSKRLRGQSLPKFRLLSSFEDWQKTGAGVEILDNVPVCDACMESSGDFVQAVDDSPMRWSTTWKTVCLPSQNYNVITLFAESSHGRLCRNAAAVLRHSTRPSTYPQTSDQLLGFM